MNSALTRYRVAAYVVGVMLLVLTGVAMPLKYLAGNPTLVEVVGPLHGFLYLGYLATAIDLAMRQRWKLVQTVVVLLGGTIPVGSFFVERWVTRTVRAGAPQPA